MSMSRKHYVAVAKRFNAMLAAIDEQVDAGFVTQAMRHPVENLATDMADIFAADNAAFDRNRFLTAAGV